MGLTLLIRLPVYAYSRARSHYCWTREVLPAAFPPWAGLLLLRQPGCRELPHYSHIDAHLSADARSTYDNDGQEPSPQAIHQSRPPSSWITGVRHNSRPKAELFISSKK